MRASAWLSCCLGIACGEAPAPPAAPAATARQSVAPSSVSLAIHAGEKIDSCVDVRPAADEADARRVLERLGKTPEPATVTRVPGDCAAAFADQRELASCVVVMGERGRMVTWRRYLFETALETEAPMRQCMQNKGRWKAVSPESEAFKSAEVESRERLPGSFARLGFPECDAYLQGMKRCLTKLEGPTQESIRQSLDMTASAWRQLAEQNDAALRESCKAAAAAITDASFCQ